MCQINFMANLPAKPVACLLSKPTKLHKMQPRRNRANACISLARDPQTTYQPRPQGHDACPAASEPLPLFGERSSKTLSRDVRNCLAPPGCRSTCAVIVRCYFLLHCWTKAVAFAVRTLR